MTSLKAPICLASLKPSSKRSSTATALRCSASRIGDRRMQEQSRSQQFIVSRGGRDEAWRQPMHIGLGCPLRQGRNLDQLRGRARRLRLTNSSLPPRIAARNAGGVTYCRKPFSAA